MMPNKRNPDPAELIRGRSARVIGQLTGILTLLKGLPASYQRDLQEDKPPLFDALAVLDSSLHVLAGMVATLRIDGARMAAAAGRGFTTATAVADAIVGEGIPFRVAHGIAGRLVAAAERAGTELDALTDADITAAFAAAEDPDARAHANDPALPDRMRAAASVAGALARCDAIGGTAPRRVAAELATHAERLGLG
jgi:argininosuccinate lyase